MIHRASYLQAISEALENNPICALLGPRQCGKTTLARAFSSRVQDLAYFDLEDVVDRSILQNPMLALSKLHGFVIIDEIQRQAELFEVLRVLADRPGNRTKFLILGSAALQLVKSASETLAGRVGFVDLSGFDLQELGPETSITLWSRGGFPRSFLSKSDSASFKWRNDFIRTFLERDIPQLGIKVPTETLRRFWTMLAHYHGAVWNAAEFARSLATSQGTARRYLDILAGAYMVRQLQPWHANIKKRQVKSPKVYLRDSGLVHALLAIQNHDQLISHPKLGASWEGFVIEQIIDISHSRDIYFWKTQAGAELDLLMFSKGKAVGYEVKYADAPKTTKSMRIAISDLGLHHLYVVYPGQKTYRLDDRISCLSIDKLAEHLRMD